ncbi:PREDICTED: spherulin-2A-like [Papilio polytes]|uniref:spherulin-2A-like n=1 Tax=Papilio polytes TaxID=76194 RepID=UPI000676ADE9|nr:PREDICTED: spherulin-2A-like [Papilio polytes]
MASYLYFLLLFPALSLARIDVKIFGLYDGIEKTVVIDFNGSDTEVISETEEKTFHLNEDRLKMSAENFFGNKPSDVFLHSPTPFGDLYQTYNWDEVKRTMKPKNGRILNITNEMRTIMSKNFVNTETKPITFNIGLKKHLENTVSSFWTKNGDLTMNKGINYAIYLGNETVTYTSLWGLNTEKSVTTVIGSDDMQISLLPGQSVTTELRAMQLNLAIEMEYMTSLSGSVATNYMEGYKGHHYWALDVDELMAANGIKNEVMSTETIEMIFYTNPQMVVFDTKTGEKMTDLIL